MVDFSAIRDEVEDQIIAATGITFKSTANGYIREVVPVTQMPSLDIATTNLRVTFQADAGHEVGLYFRIARQDGARTTNAEEFEEMIELLIDEMESYQGAAFNVLRDIEANFNVDKAGDGAMVRAVEVACIAHIE